MRTKPASRPAPGQRQRVERAFAGLLKALGAPASAEMKQTPARAAALWLDHLLSGVDADLAQIIGPGSAHRGSSPVSVTHMGVHIVCPHHLTIAFGEAHVAYSPGGRVVGFGTLSEIVRACTARFILQEEATQAVSDALVEHLGAKAAVTLIDAEHPCHNIPHPRSHNAKAITLAQAGNARIAQQLERLVAAALSRQSLQKPSRPHPKQARARS